VRTEPTTSPFLLGLAVLLAITSVPLPARADGATPAPPPVPAASSASAPAPLPAPPEPPAVPPPPPSGPPIRRSTLALGAAGIAVAATAGATTFGVLALHEKSAFDRSPTYASATNGTNDAAYADGCIALAVAAGITGLVLYLTATDVTDTGTAPATKHVVLSPIVTPHGGGAGALLRF
jgi:hypothetical protein